MNLDKSELKIGVAHELGCRLDDTLEAAQKDVLRFEGAIQAFLQASQAVEGLLSHVDKDIDEGKLDLQVAAEIKKYLVRASQVSAVLAKQAENNRLVHSGRVLAMEMSVKIVKKFQEDEATKVANFKKALSEGTIVEETSGFTPTAGGPRPVPGIRPGMSIKERRLAEEAAAAAEVTSVVPVVPNANGHANGAAPFESVPGLEQALTPTTEAQMTTPSKKGTFKKSPKRV
jgi:hypothetical protein